MEDRDHRVATDRGGSSVAKRGQVPPPRKKNNFQPWMMMKMGGKKVEEEEKRKRNLFLNFDITSTLVVGAKRQPCLVLLF